MEPRNEPNVPEEAQDRSHKRVIVLLVLFLMLILGAWLAFLLMSSSSEMTDATLPLSRPVMTSDERFTVGLSLATVIEPRWRMERDVITQAIEAAGGAVITTVADTDAALQELQVRNLLLQGVDVLIVIPQDADHARRLVELAHTKNVPVIAYDRLIKDIDVDYYLTFDNVKVGEQQALAAVERRPTGKFAYIGGDLADNNATLVRRGAYNVLQPHIEVGDIEIVLDTNVETWSRVGAYEAVRDFLATGATMDAAVVANDGMADGVIQALSEAGLDGTIPVTGQDADLAAIHRILRGTQSMTVYKPIRALAKEAASIAISMALDEEIDIDTTIENGSFIIPARLLDVLRLDANNIRETVIVDGIYAEEQVYDE